MPGNLMHYGWQIFHDCVEVTIMNLTGKVIVTRQIIEDKSFI